MPKHKTLEREHPYSKQLKFGDFQTALHLCTLSNKKMTSEKQ